MSTDQSTGGREDGRFPQESYGNAGQGSSAPVTSTPALNQGNLGGRESGRIPASGYSTNQGDGTTGGREKGLIPESSYGGEGTGALSAGTSSTLNEGSKGGRQSGAFPESSYQQTGGYEHGRAEGKLPGASYGGEGTGAISSGTSTTLNEGDKGGRQSGAFPQSSYASGDGNSSGQNAGDNSKGGEGILEQVGNAAAKLFGNQK